MFFVLLLQGAPSRVSAFVLEGLGCKLSTFPTSTRDSSSDLLAFNFELRYLKSKFKKHSVKVEIFDLFLNLIDVIENMLLLTVGT